MLSNIVEIKSKLAEKTIPLMIFDKMFHLCVAMNVSPNELLVEFYSEDVETIVWLAFSQTAWCEMSSVETKCIERMFKSYEKHNESVLNIFENPIVLQIIQKYQRG